MFANHAEPGLHPSGPTSSGERPGGKHRRPRCSDGDSAEGTADGAVGLPPLGGRDGARRGAPGHGRPVGPERRRGAAPARHCPLEEPGPFSAVPRGAVLNLGIVL